MKNVREIVEISRRSGNTTWILKSAIENPNCIIVAYNKSYAKDLEREYNRLLKKSIWYKRIIWYFQKRRKPLFVSDNFDFRGYNLPVIFDNSCFLN